MIRTIDGDNIRFYDDDKIVLSIKPVLNDEQDTVSVGLEGDIRRELATMFQDEIASFLSANIDVTLDFAKLKYISYSAMLSILELQYAAENNKLTLKLKNVQPDVKTKFVSIGFDQLLEIE